ncbi:glycoside hydrolase family 15 protein [Falsirhodobacter algicola]|uniref:Glycoside hydrolase family 15 protein n=1 Tax=Falsirhodobacter algicola TaxID=2692330 RepID=A0A8J8MR46_9RHOB|nr:glycoside hydrolase family 15 protein [Falsirhodobacter algicola]QUS34909.1 glycoside hydrolase family 15 protein [Falsirhodobacter algicola]
MLDDLRHGICDTARTHDPRRREDGFLPLDGYGALGEGRSVALSGEDGSVDWWCVPQMDSPPLFDRLLDPAEGGYFAIQPVGAFQTRRAYRRNSNVLETWFTTEDGEAVLTESLNSSTAGRLPWAELARRVECTRGYMRFRVVLRLGRRAGTVSPFMSRIGGKAVFHAGDVLGLLLTGPRVSIETASDDGVAAALSLSEGEREILAIVAGEGEPLVVPDLADIDARIDTSDEEWRQWSSHFRDGDGYAAFMLRNALALKILLFSPTGAIAAAGTTSLPERIGGDKNYDYRAAWIRDAGYTINAFMRIGAEAEAKAALTWLLKMMEVHGTAVCFSLNGKAIGEERFIEVPGYRHSSPVRVGNRAGDQFQHSTYGDIFQTVSAFLQAGNILDPGNAARLSDLADECANRWRSKDSGIWELPELRHYTTSKISCWQALTRAVELADAGQLPTTCRDRWEREAGRIRHWIEENCWSEELGAYVMYPGSTALDASITLAVRFGFPSHDRLRRTLDAVDRHLGAGPFHYRYGGMDKEEGCFIACSFWMILARALLGEADEARRRFDVLEELLGRGPGIYPEMIDPETGEWLGNLPQGLSHLAALQAAGALCDAE